jgi:hypothetical protein
MELLLVLSEVLFEGCASDLDADKCGRECMYARSGE